MQSIIEIKDILDKLNQREKNAAKKYFTRHYSNTKELQLLTLIEGLGSKKHVNVENRICKMGYVSSDSKSFQKLRSRLKNKLFDYLVSSVSLNEIRHIDSHSFLKHRLKKLLLQSDVLIEKGFFLQANETLRTCLRLSQDYEQFAQIIESLEKLRTIERIKGNLLAQDKLSDKISLFREIQDQYKSIEFLFNRLRSELDQMIMIDIDFQIAEIEKEISEAYLLKDSERIRLFSEYLNVLKLQHKKQFRKAIEIVIFRLKKFRSESMRHNLTHKMLYYDSFIELLILTNHSKWSKHFLNCPEFQSKPEHLRERSLLLMKHFELKQGVINSWDPLEIENNENLISLYQMAHHSYLSGNFRKSLDFIDRHIRQYPINSSLQLDLMNLEILCHYKLKKDDLVDYRLMSYLKNLAYRSKFNVPLHYHLTYKLFNQFNKRKFDRIEIERIGNQIQSIEISGLHELRSFHPEISRNWLTQALRTRIECTETEKVKDQPDQLNRVA